MQDTHQTKLLQLHTQAALRADQINSKTVAWLLGAHTVHDKTCFSLFVPAWLPPRSTCNSRGTCPKPKSAETKLAPNTKQLRQMEMQACSPRTGQQAGNTGDGRRHASHVAGESNASESTRLKAGTGGRDSGRDGQATAPTGRECRVPRLRLVTP